MGYNNLNMATNFKTVGTKIQAARRQRGLTQAEVAKKVGMQTNYYATIERGDRVPSLQTLEKIIKALDVKSSDVLPF